MKYTYFGQSCFLLEANGYKLLFDPFISPNPLAKDVDMSKIEADYIFVSHGHGDHVADLITLAKQTNATVVAVPEITGWVEKKGVKNIHSMNFGSFAFDFGKVRMVSALHSSSLPDGSYAGNPAGFVLEVEGKQIYFAGDTALTLEMKILADLYKLDYAILPIGGNYTMDADDALIATKYLNCNTAIGVHYNTFPVIKIDTEDALDKFTREQKVLLLPQIGETISL